MNSGLAWVVAAGLALSAVVASAQPYPTKPIRIVVPFPAAGAADILARSIGQELTRAWGQQVVADNRPGAGGNIGADLAAKATPDGYTLFLAAATTHAASVSLYSKLPYNLEKDLAPVTLAANISHILLTHPTVPAKTVNELVALAKSQPGRLRGLAVAGSKRSPAVSALPTIGESLKGFEADNWFGVMVPAGTPKNIVATLNAQIVKVLSNPEMRKLMLARGAVLHASTPGEFAAVIRSDIAKWARVVKRSGARIE